MILLKHCILFSLFMNICELFHCVPNQVTNFVWDVIEQINIGSVHHHCFAFLFIIFGFLCYRFDIALYICPQCMVIHVWYKRNVRENSKGNNHEWTKTIGIKQITKANNNSKNTTYKTIISNMDPTKKLGMNPGARKG
jgi:hypothetical protein